MKTQFFQKTAQVYRAGHKHYIQCLVFLALAALLFASCEEPTKSETETETTYSLTVGVASGQSAMGSAAIASGSAAGNAPGTSVTVAATAASSGYAFEKWAVDEAGATQVSAANPHTFAITADTALYAVFKVDTPAGERTMQTVNGISVPFRYVSAGSFQRDIKSGNISVISTGYRLAETAVTQELFQAVMRANPSYFSSGADSGEAQNRRPVDTINWYHAIAFCNKLSIADGKQPVYSVKVGGMEVDWANLAYAQIPNKKNADWDAAVMDLSKNGYRLPTEMEWMWAAIGAEKASQPNTTGYSKAFAGSNGSNNINDYVWYSETPDTHSKTHEVAKKLPNELGLYDMSGNVWEWCWDWSNGGLYPEGMLTDYAGASSGSARVLRGGSYYNSANYMRPVARNSNTPYYPMYYYGFRVVLP